MSTANFTLAIVDDHGMIIEGLKTLMRNNDVIDKIEGFLSGTTFLQAFQKIPYPIVFLDMMLPDTNGIELCQRIKSMRPETIVLGLSNHAERSMILKMLNAGANGYLLKNVNKKELHNAIDEAIKGNTVFCKEVQRIIASPDKTELESIPSLTKRELEILSLIAGGMTSQQIAEKIFLSPLTVETHRKNMLHKFKVSNIASLIMLATKHKLLD
ncbi:response regulator [Sphingobacterium suaedae]|uniref:Response regulator n=1 Tax=Sphingobacterium suaedae TaxID=1686402 RepID=A0ABW5KNK3_9SPHI